MSDTTWKHVADLVRWLDAKNGTADPEPLLRVLKVQEEAGEVASAVIGMIGQNPRKGRTHTADDVAAELCDVALSALVALASYTTDSRATWEAHVAKVAARAGSAADR
ncbi:MazG-like family protein [Herbidospora mongoliensis]|uniref:MazG-like family protein n=1 Tax=Herbidospora mongoliensis TaxID=688067 RepID=UPI00083129EF|nr:MazG-like family protein [Herbidospora mongoliensis]